MKTITAPISVRSGLHRSIAQRGRRKNMKFKSRGSVLATSALAIALAPSLLAFAPANATTNSAKGAAGAVVESTALEIYNTLDFAKDPQASFDALSPSDQSTFNDYFLPSTFDETVNLTPLDSAATKAQINGAVASTYSSLQEAKGAMALAASGCWGTVSKMTASATFGNDVWATYNEGSWCNSGSSVTSASFGKSWTSIAALGWRDGGQTGSGSAVVSNQGRVWSQRKMILGVGGWDVQTVTQCNRFSGNANGSTSAAASCSIY